MATIIVRKPEEIYQIDGRVEKRTFHGRWHFSFDEYFDPRYVDFGTKGASTRSFSRLLPISHSRDQI